MHRWEYHWVEADEAEALYERIVEGGQHGWELVNVTATVRPDPGKGAFDSSGMRKPSTFQAWFKRPSAQE